MPDYLVFISHAAIEVGAILGRLGVGKVGHLAIKAAAARHIHIVSALGSQIDDRSKPDRPDVRVTAGRACFCDQSTRQLVVGKLILGEEADMLTKAIACSQSE